jgi:hypothetical protein
VPDIENALKLRSFIGRVAAVFCVLFCVVVLDAIVAGFRQSPTELDALPGTSIEINGLAAEKIESAEDVVYKSSSDLVQLSVDSIQKGHWFGNKMWQGRILISPNAEAGEYSLSIGTEDMKSERPPEKFLVRIYKDYESYRQSFKSLIKRYLDVTPWVFAAIFAGAVVLAFGYIFLLSGKIENLMAAQGKAVIYRVKNSGESCEISFGLGADHGIKVSLCLSVFDELGKTVGTAVVKKVSPSNSLAAMEPDIAVKPGYLVSI